MNPPVTNARLSPSGPIEGSPNSIDDDDILTSNLSNLDSADPVGRFEVTTNGDFVNVKGTVEVVPNAASAKSLRLQAPIGRSLSAASLVEANVTTAVLGGGNVPTGVCYPGTAALTASNVNHIGALLYLGTLGAATSGDHYVHVDLTFHISAA